MDLSVGAVVIDVNDLDRMQEFWAQALGYEVAVHREDDWTKLSDPDDRCVHVSLQKVPERRSEKNRLHLDLYSRRPQEEVRRLESLGARIERTSKEDEDFTVLSDPEGNLFCVIDKSESGAAE